MKYLFTAIFEDGGVYRQNPNDVSAYNPQKSCFYDVQEMAKKSELKLFHLTGDGTTYTVNLRTGQFDINGKTFFLHDTDLHVPHKRLIYFRRVWRDMNNNGEVIQTSYFIGWQATLDGKNIQHTINVL